MDDHEVPHHFICPISLQIMKDPVTVATGITYDRDSIQRWQLQSQTNTCPVTNQPLPTGSDHFTPNHNLCRLIQAWSVSISDQDPPSDQPPSFRKESAIKLIKNLNPPPDQKTQLKSLQRLENLASGNEKNRVCLKEIGVVKAMVSVVVSCYRNGTIFGLKEALNVLYLVGLSQDETSSILEEHDHRIISSLTWVLDYFGSCDHDDTRTKFHAIVSLKSIIQYAKPHVLERLKRDFFQTIIRTLHQFQQHKKKLVESRGVEEGLHVMLSTCTWPRNCSMMIEAGAVFELVELELGSPDKPTTELVMGVLFHLCCSADGRAQLLGHAAGIAMITKRIGKVSEKADERCLMIISLISKFSATDGVLQEMVRVGTIEKLMMVLQVNGRHSYQRDKAREILKRHSNVWKDSPCLDLTLLTRYPQIADSIKLS